ncbi:tail fiber protein, partial [Pseudomonas sp. GW456-L14]
MANEKTPPVQAVSAEAVGPKVADLTSKFKEQSIPLEVDFKNLIEIADVGRKAVGLSADQSNNEPGNGIAVTGEGKLEVKASNDGFQFVDGKLSLKQGAGWGFAQNGDVDILVDENGGVLCAKEVGSQLSIKAGYGIKVDSDGVSFDIHSILPAGMIMMFSGSTIPSGWAICNGEGGTPNLVDKFILGGTLDSLGGSNSVSLSGDKNNKVWAERTDSQTPDINLSISGHKLTEDEIPTHNHIEGLKIRHTDDLFSRYWYNVGGLSDDLGTDITTITEGGRSCA